MPGPHLIPALSGASWAEYPNHLEIRCKGDTGVIEYEVKKRRPLANFKDSLSQMKFLKILEIKI